MSPAALAWALTVPRLQPWAYCYFLRKDVLRTSATQGRLDLGLSVAAFTGRVGAWRPDPERSTKAMETVHEVMTEYGGKGGWQSIWEGSRRIRPRLRGGSFHYLLSLLPTAMDVPVVSPITPEKKKRKKKKKQDAVEPESSMVFASTDEPVKRPVKRARFSDDPPPAPPRNDLPTLRAVLAKLDNVKGANLDSGR